MNYRVTIQVIKVYSDELQAESEDAAIQQAYALQTTEIEREWKQQDVSTDYASAEIAD